MNSLKALIHDTETLLFSALRFLGFAVIPRDDYKHYVEKFNHTCEEIMNDRVYTYIITTKDQKQIKCVADTVSIGRDRVDVYFYLRGEFVSYICNFYSIEVKQDER